MIFFFSLECFSESTGRVTIDKRAPSERRKHTYTDDRKTYQKYGDVLFRG